MTRRLKLGIPVLGLALALAGTAAAEAGDRHSRSRHRSSNRSYGRDYGRSYRYVAPPIYVGPSYGYYGAGYGYAPYYDDYGYYDYGRSYGPYYRNVRRYPAYGYSRYSYRPRYRRPNFSIHIGF